MVCDSEYFQYFDVDGGNVGAAGEGKLDVCEFVV